MISHRVKLLLDIAGFQVIWFACALGVPNGVEWIVYPLGLIYVFQHLYFSNQRNFELRLILKSVLLGLVVDSGLVIIHALSFTSSNNWIQPLWMTILWASLGASLSSSLSWLKSRQWIAAILGAIVGPLSYLGGEKFGALVIHGMPGFIALAICWAIVMRLALSWLNQKDVEPSY